MGSGIALWSRSRWPQSRWRRGARSAIAAVVDACLDDAGRLPEDILERVDAAYPFGERKYQPYKEWLKERAIFRGALAETTAVTADEIAACEVARDLIEVGDPDPIKLAALLEQAPNRLARKCPACAAKPGSECIQIVSLDLDFTAPTSAMHRSHAASLVARRNIPIPHHARLVGHLDAGPLFTARTT